MNIFKLLEIGVELGASDIHITVDSPPIARVKGSFIKLREENLSKEDTFQMAKEVTGPKKFKILEENVQEDGSIIVKLKKQNNQQPVGMPAYRKNDYIPVLSLTETGQSSLYLSLFDLLLLS